jgi:uncharacterized damage-inducible protein DinB
MQIRLAVALTLAVPCAAAAQGLEAATPLFEMSKDWLVKSADMITAANWNFKPTPAVRSFGELIGHVADANYMFCSIALGEKSPATAQFEKVTDRAAVVKGLKDAMAYCDKAYKIAPAKLTEQVTMPFGNMKGSKLWVLMFNVAHNNEHYGNLVTYFRLKNMVPPSSQGSGM